MGGLLDIRFAPGTIKRGCTRLQRIQHQDMSVSIDCGEEVDLLVNLSGGHRVEGRVDGVFRSEMPRPGSVSVLPPSCPVRIQISGDCSVLILRIEWREMLEFAAQNSISPDRLVIQPRVSDDDPLLARLLFRAAAADTPLARETAIAAIASNLVARSVCIPKRRQSVGLSGNILRRSIELIDSSTAEDVSLSALSQSAGLSLHHFARGFNLATGYSPHQYIVKRRTERAIDLLARSQLSIRDIAKEAGFTHASHQARHVRRLTSLSPQEYRRHVVP